MTKRISSLIAASSLRIGNRFTARGLLPLAAVVVLGSSLSANASAGPITSFGSYGTGPGQFKTLYGLAVDQTGDVYATDVDATGLNTTARVEVFSNTGTFERQWGSPGTADGQFKVPLGVAVGPNGNIYVADTNNHRIQQFTTSGSFIRTFGSYGSDPGELQSPSNIAVGPGGDVYVPGDSRQLSRFDSVGTFLNRWGGDGAADGQFQWGNAPMATGPAGHIYVGDATRVQRFTAAGDFEYKWPANLDHGIPLGLAIDSSGRIFGSTVDKHIVEYAPDGAILSSIALPEIVGNIAVSNTGVIYGASEVNLSGKIFRINTTEPDAQLAPMPDPIDTGQQVTLDASASSVPFSAPSNISWDLDGDGSFETNGGTSDQLSTKFSSLGVRNVGVRVTAPSGKTATASTPVDVRLASPAGLPGASINSGEIFTNDPDVTLAMKWPEHATSMVISNDGGFSGAVTRDVAATTPWKLVSSGPERLPKTVYVRFTGGSSGPETYQDDIILDQTPPVISKAAIGSGGNASATNLVAGAAAVAKTKITMKASDKTSGVGIAQTAVKKAHPSAKRKFSRSFVVKGARPKFVRVQDNAGNFSKWKSLSTPRH